MATSGRLNVYQRSVLAGALYLFLGATCVVWADEKADVQALIDRVIKAGGGEANLNKYQGQIWKATGKHHETGLTFTGEFSCQLPDRSRDEIVWDDQGTKIKLIAVFNRDKGWTIMNDDEPKDLEDDELKVEQTNAHVNWLTSLTPLKDKALQVTSLGESKVADRPVIGIKVVHKGRPDVKMFFDKESALLLKTENKTKDTENDKEVTEETFLSAYKDVQGVQQPTRIRVKWDGKPHMDIDISEWKLKEKLEDSLFIKPKKDME
jgi:hypothetical protein